MSVTVRVIPLATAFAVALAGCGGEGSGQEEATAEALRRSKRITVSVTPADSAVAAGASQQFEAAVSNTGNTAVIWTVQEGAAGGDVSSSGLYTAPSSAGTFHVVATSVANTNRSASATVAVNAQAPVVAVSVSPTSASLTTGGTKQFAATVTGTTNVAVGWIVQEGAAGGTVTSSGLYTAPATPGTYHVVATSQADLTKSAVATVTVGSSTASSDLCAGLVQDKANHPMVALSKPAAGQAYTDPSFGTVIRRISDASAAGQGNIIPVYSTIQAWNADESYMILYWVGNGTHHLYNGKTYAHIKALNIRPADMEQVYWDVADPKILYYTDGSARKLYAFNVDTNAATLVHDFSGLCSSSLSGGVDPMWTSWGSHQVFGYVCGSKIFSYDRATDTVGTVASATTGGNAPMPGPSASYFFLNVNDSAAQVRDANMNLLGTLANVSPAEHATVGSSDGVDTLFSVQFDSYEGTVVASNLATRASRVIVGPPTGWPYPPSGTHLSAVGYKNPGWVSASIVGNTSGQTTLNQEIILVNADAGGTVCRVGHHRSRAASYWAEPHVSMSPSGTRLLFGSDWGGGATADSYVVELPSYTP